MGLCFSLDQDEQKARAKSDLIDKRLQKWAKDDENVINILLLGEYSLQLQPMAALGVCGRGRFGLGRHQRWFFQ